MSKEKSIALKDMSLSTSVEDLLASGALPTSIDSKEKFMTIAQYGKELGWDPMTSVNSISLIRGKMTVASSMLGALLKKHGYEYIWLKDHEPDDNDPTKIVSEIQLFWVSKSLNREFSQKFKTSWNELIVAGLVASNPTYSKFPKAMLRARTLAFAVRAIAPEVLAGAYTDMEIIDKGTEGFDIDVNEEGEVTVVANNEHIDAEEAVVIEETVELKEVKPKTIIKKK